MWFASPRRARHSRGAARLERWLDSPTPPPVRVVAGPAALRAVGVGDRSFRD